MLTDVLIHSKVQNLPDRCHNRVGWTESKTTQTLTKSVWDLAKAYETLSKNPCKSFVFIDIVALPHIYYSMIIVDQYLKEIQMKKYLAILALAFTGASFAGGFANVDVEHVTDRSTGAKSTAQYIRAGTELGGYNVGLQSRTARANDGGTMFNSLETYVGKSIGAFSPFVGVGYDNGLNGARGGQYTYGVVGVNAGTKVGPGFAMGGVKTRVNWDHDNPKQTVVFANYSIPVAKQVSVGLGVSRSSQDIKERGLSAGVTVAF